uniref:Uncharacterized protein n=1 Tax=Anguilla anguilla TaxID=7936 RepID=A0A0E9QIB0_ANGAN
MRLEFLMLSMGQC